MIDHVETVNSAKPTILVDAADSCNAGAPGDSMAAAARLLRRGSRLRAATVVNDAAAFTSHRLGVGGRPEFHVGTHHERATLAGVPSRARQVCSPGPASVAAAPGRGGVCGIDERVDERGGCTDHLGIGFGQMFTGRLAVLVDT